MKKIINFRVVNRQIFHYPFKLDLEKLKNVIHHTTEITLKS